MIKYSNFLMILIFISFEIIILCSCKVLINNNEYQHFVLLSSIKSNNLKIQDIFGEDIVDFYTKGNIIIVKKKMLVKQNGIEIKNAFGYYLVNSSNLNCKTINFFSFKNDYKIMSHNMIDSIFSNTELLNKIKKDNYYSNKENKNREINTVIFYNIKNKQVNTLQIDSIVFSYLRKNKDLIMPLWKIDNYYPVVNLELYSKMPDSSLNNVLFKITKEASIKSRFLDSVLLKYDKYLN